MTGYGNNGRVDLAMSQVTPGAGDAGIAASIAATTGISSVRLAELNNSLKAIDQSLDLRKVGSDASALKDYFSKLTSRPLTNGVSTVNPQPFVFSLQNLSKEFPGPAKFYAGKNTNNIPKHRWVLPVPPADFSVSVPNSQTTITTISGFTYTHAGNIELDEISFEGFFPFVNGTSAQPDFLPKYLSTTGDSATFAYRTPNEWVTNLVTAMRANQPLLFSVFAIDESSTISTSGGVIIQPVAMSISSFDWNMGTSVGGSRRDINYSITLKRWRRQSLCITNYVGNIKPGGGGANGADPDVNVGIKKYTTKHKDTLYIIAQRSPAKMGLGNGHRWGEINALNHKVIEKSYNIYLKNLPSGAKKKTKANHPLRAGIVLIISKAR